MRILDISALPAITEVGYYSTGGATLGIASAQDLIFVGDWEDGLYIFGNDLIQPSTVHELLPDQFSLQQNFPNPFNPQTTIAFSLLTAAQVELAIYTIDGHRVATLLNGLCESGHHDVVWRGRDASGKAVSSGHYLYRLVVDGACVTKSMLLLR
jgi:hypothetical protein